MPTPASRRNNATPVLVVLDDKENGLDLRNLKGWKKKARKPAAGADAPLADRSTPQAASEIAATPSPVVVAPSVFDPSSTSPVERVMARLGLRGRTSTSPGTASKVPIDKAATDPSEEARSSLVGLSVRDPSDTGVTAARSARKTAEAGCLLAPLLRRAAARCEARIEHLVSLKPGEYPPGVALGELQLEGAQLQAMARLWPPLHAILEAHATAQEWLEASAGAAGGAAAAGRSCRQVSRDGRLRLGEG